MGRPSRTDLALTGCCALIEMCGLFFVLRRAFRV